MGIYDNPGGLIAGSVVLQVLTTTCVALRFYTRHWKGQKIIVSDWLVLAAWVFGTMLTVDMLYGVAHKAFGYPLGAHIEDASAINDRLNLAKALQLSYYAIGVIALGLIKLSITFFYYYLFAKVKLRRFLICWIVVLILWTIAFVIFVFLECGTNLMAIFGTPDDYTKYCQAAIPGGYALMSTDIATDLITLMIPIPIVMSLKMSPWTRVLTLLTFMVGGLSVAASCVKAYIYVEASLGRWTMDAISLLTSTGLWNLVEVQVGIIAACGPTLRPVLSKVFPSERIVSFMSLLGISQKSKSSTEPLPSFVKVPSQTGSFEKLKRKERDLDNTSRSVSAEYEMGVYAGDQRGGSGMHGRAGQAF